MLMTFCEKTKPVKISVQEHKKLQIERGVSIQQPTKINKAKGQTMICQTLHRKLKIMKYDPHKLPLELEYICLEYEMFSFF